MSDFLSQDELDALLKSFSESLPEEDKKTIESIVTLIFDPASSALGMIVGRETRIKIAQVTQTSLKDFITKATERIVLANIKLSEALQLNISIAMPASLVLRIVDLMMGGSGEPTDQNIDDIKLSALNEALNQMIGASLTLLAEKAKGKVSLAKLDIKPVDDIEKISMLFNPTELLVCAECRVEMENSSPSSLWLFAQLTALREVNEKLFPKEKKQEKVKVQPAKFEEFTPAEAEVPLQPTEIQQKLELLFDVPLKIVVELGRARMTLKQVLDLTVGSLIELDKLTGEPVDVLVNGRLIARGEVVVIDENFGVRITEIVSPKQRLYSIRETNGV
ncbi:flagellar motor switch protein FliN [Thermotoga sp. Ku-13t]|uniref:flagellar motor switch protein FliN n=1 Tax=Thermotoga sp. Ku-13t TaxID=1755813 RepID=UPI0013ECD4FA|nr:flagellar motor switch protein FliN [Thermotoga sp. Ku-13t]KAF2957931.1 flagellar motor switch protein FliN [Thermotoga sp. Ku-13t]